MTENLLLKRVQFNDPDFQTLIQELDKEFWVRYPDTQQNFEPFNKVDDACRVVVVYHHVTPIGCGCFRPKPDSTVEIKRMYVRPDDRNQGIAKRILNELELQAVAEGFTRSILETGIKQPEAIRSYKNSGYHTIPNIPPY